MHFNVHNSFVITYEIFAKPKAIKSNWIKFAGNNQLYKIRKRKKNYSELRIDFQFLFCSYSTECSNGLHSDLFSFCLFCDLLCFVLVVIFYAPIFCVYIPCSVCVNVFSNIDCIIHKSRWPKVMQNKYVITFASLYVHANVF